jgi:hypothetical protein
VERASVCMLQGCTHLFCASKHFFTKKFHAVYYFLHNYAMEFVSPEGGCKDIASFMATLPLL